MEFISFIINSYKSIHEVFLFRLIVKKKKKKKKKRIVRVNEQLSDMINSAVKFGSEVNAAQEPNDTKILGAGYKRASVGKRITAEIC